MRVAVRSAVLVLLWACQEPTPLYPPSAPLEIREACALTQRKCTQCHDRDRIIEAQFGVVEWRNTVERMRQIPGSSIAPANAEVIVHCLTYRGEPRR